MATEILLRYVHFVSIFTIVSTLVAEHLLLKREMKPSEIDRLSFIDMIYGIAALALLTAGLTLWLGGHGKPTDYYSLNWIFILKISLYVAVGLLSIYPTVFFIKNRKKEVSSIIVPGIIVWLIRMELLLMFIIPLLAGLMAKGYGYLG